MILKELESARIWFDSEGKAVYRGGSRIQPPRTARSTSCLKDPRRSVCILLAFGIGNPTLTREKSGTLRVNMVPARMLGLPSG